MVYYCLPYHRPLVSLTIINFVFCISNTGSAPIDIVNSNIRQKRKTNNNNKTSDETIMLPPPVTFPDFIYPPNESTRSNPRRKHTQRTAGGYSTATTVDDVFSCGYCCYTIESASKYSDQLDLSFYSKAINLDGFLITSSSSTSDTALYEAALTYDKMTRHRPDFRSTLVNEGVHLTVIGKDEVTTDVPEYEWLGPGWDWTRGLGATKNTPVTSCAEENLLCLDNDPYASENICVHETAHTMQGSGKKLPTVRYVDSDNQNEDLDDALRAMYYSSVTSNGLWENTYAATNHEEYWAEATQSFYDVNTEGPVGGNGIHNNIDTRNELASYDTDLYDLLSRVLSSDVSFDCPPTTACDCSSYICPSTTPSSCNDSPFRFKTIKPTDGSKVMRDCGWAATRSTKVRCSWDGVASMCPSTCGTCNTCVDSTSRFKFFKNPTDKKKIARDCSWTANKSTNFRCAIEGMEDTCRKTCGTC